MKERPILFSAPMVRAILAGTKTQTRRVVKPQPPAEARDAGCITSFTDAKYVGIWWWLDSLNLLEAGIVGDEFRCPYGNPGDQLWVRESHSIGPDPSAVLLPGEDYGALRWPHVTYAADGAIEKRDTVWTGQYGRSRPSIHMPRWACRLVLEISDVRVQRLHEITEADAVAEGASTPGPFAVHHFMDLWISINGRESWLANPWVWALTFRRLP